MSDSSDTPRMAGRTKLAVAGARAGARSTITGPGQGADRTANVLFLALLLLSLSVAIVGLVTLLVWAVVTGSSQLRWSLLFNGPSTLNPDESGYRYAITGTVYVIGGVIALIVPLGVGAAVYLEEYADKTKWYNRMVELNIQNLAGVPSIVFGILGLAFVVRGPLSLNFVAAAGSITVAMLVLPTVILASREAIRAVPSSIRDGSLALGATPWQTTWKQVLPTALPGILTGLILSIARAIGEAAPLLLVGAVTFVTFPPRFFEGGYSTLPVMIFNYAGRPQEVFRTIAVAGVVVMVGLLLIINAFAIWLRNRYETKF